MIAYMLIVIHGSEQERAYEITDNVITIGRDSSCQIRLNDSTVSRHHARITLNGDTLTIEDLDSNNGTFLNGLPVTTNRLRVDDIVTLGKVELQLRQATNMPSMSSKSSASGVLEYEDTRMRQLPDRHPSASEKSESTSIMNITQRLSSADPSVSSPESLKTIHRITRMASSEFD